MPLREKENDVMTGLNILKFFKTDFMRSSAIEEARARFSMSKIFFSLPFLLLGFALLASSPAEAQVFDGPGGSGSGWIQMLRGNYTFDGTSPIADTTASVNYMGALRIAMGVYSNALLIVASVILLYHLLIMVTETAHQGVVGGKRMNQVWAPLRLVIAIGLLVPMASGLNSGQYIALQIIEWGSNMATTVWATFTANAGTGGGTNPIPYLPDVGSIAREAAKIGACKGVINNFIDVSNAVGGPQIPAGERVRAHIYGPAILYGNDKYESLCGSVIIFSFGAGAIGGMITIQTIIDQIAAKAPSFVAGNPDYGTDPGTVPLLIFSAVLGALDSIVSFTSWDNGAAGVAAGTGWVSAGAYFLKLAAGVSNRVSGTDSLPIIMGPKAELIPSHLRGYFYNMATWIVGRYRSHLSGGGADPDIIGNTVAGRKFVDLLLLFMDEMGVISGLWLPGSAAFTINLNNSPLAELVDLGHRMIRTALDFIGSAVELGVNVPQHAAYAALADAYKPGGPGPEVAFGPKSGQAFGTMAIPIVSAAASSLIMMGLMLGIFMPLLPFFTFVLSVMTWLISVIETLVCVPLMSLAYLTPYGEGFGGQKVEPGYHLILHTFLRPVMTIFGLIAAILLFNIAAHLITTFYYAITMNSGAFRGGMFVVTKLAFGMMYVSMMYTCLNGALKVVNTFGRNAIRWVGGHSHEEAMGDAAQAVSMAQQGTGMLSSGLSSLAMYAPSAGALLSNDRNAPAYNPQAANPSQFNPNPPGPQPRSVPGPQPAPQPQPQPQPQQLPPPPPLPTGQPAPQNSQTLWSAAHSATGGDMTKATAVYQQLTAMQGSDRLTQQQAASYAHSMAAMLR